MKAKSKLIQIKNKTLEAYYKGMLPSRLVKLVYELKPTDDINYVEYLSDLTYEYFRLKGYYKNDVKNNEANQQIDFIVDLYRENLKKGE